MLQNDYFSYFLISSYNKKLNAYVNVPKKAHIK